MEFVPKGGTETLKGVMHLLDGGPVFQVGDKIYTEAPDRLILPGAQALLGFQLISCLTEAFQKLSKPVQGIHLVALGLVVLSAIFLITIPAYHRIGEQGGESEHFNRVGSRLLISALVALAAGISVDFGVVILKVTSSITASFIGAAGALGTFSGLWFVYPLACKAKAKMRQP